jgi:hypothetical protein
MVPGGAQAASTDRIFMLLFQRTALTIYVYNCGDAV